MQLQMLNYNIKLKKKPGKSAILVYTFFLLVQWLLLVRLASNIRELVLGWCFACDEQCTFSTII
jgi:hypothetical protein